MIVSLQPLGSEAPASYLAHAYPLHGDGVSAHAGLNERRCPPLLCVERRVCRPGISEKVKGRVASSLLFTGP
jgi:hypothetical protein